MIKFTTLSDIKVEHHESFTTGIELFDKWFSADGGMVLGSSIFVTGTSGAGKTTLMACLGKWLSSKKICMYQREMSKSAVKKQISYLKLEKNKNFYIQDQKDFDTFQKFFDSLDELKPDILIVDSLQVIILEDYEANDAHSYNVIKMLREWADQNNSIVFLIGHNTKDGQFAGKNTNMQMMDAHIEMVYDKKNNSRTISWGVKNRKGPLGTLNYDFFEGGIQFFTEEQWKQKQGVKNLSVLGHMDFAMKNLIELAQASGKIKESKKHMDRLNKFILEKSPILSPKNYAAALFQEVTDIING